MDTAKKNAILDAAAAEVERQQEAIDSRQPRFQGKGQAFGTTLSWVKMAEIEQVPYSSNSMARDSWLRAFWRLEPRLAGIVNDVTLIDSNRGWSMVGGRNQVRRYTDVLHAADGGAGWRTFSRKSALSYWATDCGAVTELGREGEQGPLRGVYHTDSARCLLTGEPDYPLQYNPVSGAPQRWPAGSFFRICSMPSDDELFHGLGYSAVSRCVELARIMYAVMQHDQEMLGARAPRGLLLLQNISEEQWNNAMQSRADALDGLERKYFGGVAVLASTGVDQIDAKLVALSQLPAGFDAETFMNLTMYGYALCFGYDPREFWPVSGGQLGTALETETQHNKATSKGGMEFALAFQEHLQDELPETLQFEFEQRDDAGELQTAAVQSAKLSVIAAAYNAGLVQGAPLISREEARVLLAEQGLIPEEWTAVEEEVEATDTEDADTQEEAEEVPEGEQPEKDPTEEEPESAPAERWLSLERVQRAMSRFPREPIVRYQWPSKQSTILWQPRTTPKFHPVVKRASEDVLYKGRGVTITQEDVDRAVAEAKRRVGEEFAQILQAPELTPEQLAKLGGA